MQLKLFREHYLTKDSGVTWTPKKTFDTEEEAREVLPNTDKWNIYICGLCDKYHSSTIYKGDANDN
jgi:hypothetical protein